MKIRCLSKFALLILLFGCSPKIVVHPVKPIPSSTAIINSGIVAEFQQHTTRVETLTNILNLVEISEKGLNRILELDRIRYYYIRRAEFLIAGGDFEETKRYIRSANNVLNDIIGVLREEATEKPAGNQSETSIQQPKTVL